MRVQITAQNAENGANDLICGFVGMIRTPPIRVGKSPIESDTPNNEGECEQQKWNEERAKTRHANSVPDSDIWSRLRFWKVPKLALFSNELNINQAYTRRNGTSSSLDALLIAPFMPSPLHAFGSTHIKTPFEGRIDGRKRKRFQLQTKSLPKSPGVYFFYGQGERLL